MLHDDASPMALGALLAVALTPAFWPNGASAAPEDRDICADYRGTALWGQCTRAVVNGCHESELAHPRCEQWAEIWREQTGIDPPWLAVLQVFTASGAITFSRGARLETVLDVGDPFVAIAVYDDALLTGSGLEEISLDPSTNPGHSFDLTIGDPAAFIFDETDAIGFGVFGAPTIRFLDGNFVGFDFVNELPDHFLNAELHLGADLTVWDESDIVLQGEFQEISQEPARPD